MIFDILLLSKYTDEVANKDDNLQNNETRFFLNDTHV